VTEKDFASNCALEVMERAGRILPVLQSHLEISNKPLLSEVQMIALGSVLLIVFDGLTDTLERMASTKELLERLNLGEEAERYLADLDGPLQ
jgi:hypothetical protein